MSDDLSKGYSHPDNVRIREELYRKSLEGTIRSFQILHEYNLMRKKNDPIRKVGQIIGPKPEQAE